MGPPALALAVLFAASPAGAQTMPIGERIEQCAACHGKDGVSELEKVPSLAGQPDFFILNQLVLMREGVRPIEQMAAIVKELTDGEIQALAAHFAKLAPRASEEKVNAELAKRGAALSVRLRCGSCHGPNLAGEMQMPRLARQRIDYMSAAMKDYRDNKRAGADTAITAVIFGLSDADIDALAHYAAGK